jgi:hypothetical protein
MAKPRRAPERPLSHPISQREDEQGRGVRIPAGRDLHRRQRRTRAETTPQDVTGINPENMEPIDPRMVYIPPA